MRYLFQEALDQVDTPQFAGSGITLANYGLVFEGTGFRTDPGSDPRIRVVQPVNFLGH